MIAPKDTSAWEPKEGWEINMGPDHVYDPGETYWFRLTPRMDGSLPCYEVTYEPKKMDPAWEGCRLYWRGQNEVAWGDRKLDPWQPTLEYVYDKTIESFLLNTDSDTVRLEGEIVVNDKKEAVTVFLSRDAVRTETANTFKPLLIIITRTGFPWSQPRLTLSQDGTAHAKPR